MVYFTLTFSTPLRTRDTYLPMFAHFEQIFKEAGNVEEMVSHPINGLSIYEAKDHGDVVDEMLHYLPPHCPLQALY